MLRIVSKMHFSLSFPAARCKLCCVGNLFAERNLVPIIKRDHAQVGGRHLILAFSGSRQ